MWCLGYPARGPALNSMTEPSESIWLWKSWVWKICHVGTWQPPQTLLWKTRRLTFNIQVKKKHVGDLSKCSSNPISSFSDKEGLNVIFLASHGFLASHHVDFPVKVKVFRTTTWIFQWKFCAPTCGLSSESICVTTMLLLLMELPLLLLPLLLLQLPHTAVEGLTLEGSSTSYAQVCAANTDAQKT